MRVINLVPAMLVGFAIYLAWRATSRVAEPLLLITLAIVVAAALNPLVLWAQLRFHVPRAVSSAVILFLVIGSLGLLTWLLVPTLVSQLSSLIQNLPGQVEELQGLVADWGDRSALFHSLSDSVRTMDLASQVQRVLPSTLAGALGATTGLLNGLLLGVLMLLLGFYVLLQPEPLVRGALSGIPARYRDDVGRALVRVGGQLGSWLSGTVFLSAAMGVLVWIALTSLGLFGIHVQNVFLFAVIAAVTNVIPVIGGLIGMVPPVLASLSPNPVDALWVGVAVFLVQQIVYQVLTPIVFGRGANLHPASLLAGVLIFSGLFGWVGAFLAVPFLIIVKAVYEELYLPTVAGGSMTAAEARDLVKGSAPEARE
ncbi:MAG TPA: AI-2E family transporter [Deinococcales bacterium]|nr:AI-2E family transporter [Deinococcales bacterium]